MSNRRVDMPYWAIAKKMAAAQPKLRNDDIYQSVLGVVKRYKKERHIDIVLTDLPGKIIKSGDKSYMIDKRGEFNEI